jgi:NitT/TauT family transport system substrate-binding protein
MQMINSRRGFLGTVSSAGVMVLLGDRNSIAQDAPPETTTIRLIKNSGICVAPQYVADELLRAEGFTDIQHVMRSPAVMAEAIGRGEVDMSLHFAALLIPQLMPAKRSRSWPACMSGAPGEKGEPPCR